jgi:hypothetical protein
MFKHFRSLLLATRYFCNDNEAPRPAPPPPRFARCASSSGPPPPLSRGRMVHAASFSRRIASEACRPKLRIFCLRKIKGGGAPVGATVPWGLATQRMSPSHCASGEAARPAGRARLSALHRGACSGQLPKLDPGRASRDAVRRRYPHLGTALKRSTSRAGRNAGGVDARTARERQ